MWLALSALEIDSLAAGGVAMICTLIGMNPGVVSVDPSSRSWQISV